MISFTKKIIIVFIVLSIGILLVGFLYSLFQYKAIKNEKGKELSAITDLKVKQILEWRKERLGDAEVIFSTKLINNDLKNFLINPSDIELKKSIMDFMRILKTYESYKNFILFSVGENIIPILNTNGQVWKSDSQINVYFKECINTKHIIFTDIFENEITHEIHIDLLIPLIDDDSSKVIGIFQIQIDPYKFLYPLIQSWPFLSDSAESLLVHKEGDSVVYLNELRYKKNTALKLKFDINRNKNNPAVMAVQGKKGLVEGVDYRNVPVLSCIQAIPNSPWFIIAKVDKKELYGSINKRVWIVSILFFLFVIGAGLLLLMFWQRQDAVFKAKESKAELDRLVLEKHFDYLSKYANDIIILTDNDFNIIEVNDRAIEVYGFSRAEFLQKNIKDFRKTQHPYSFKKEKKLLLENKRLLFETEHVKKDGKAFPVEINTRAIFVDDKIYFQGIIRDITERKKIEESLRSSELFLDSIIEHSPHAMWISDDKGTLIRLNQACRDLLHITDKEVVGIYNVLNDNMVKEQGFLPLVKKVFEKGETVNFTLTYDTLNLKTIKLKNRAFVILDVTISPVLGSNGKIKNAIIQHINVTEQKKAEETLHESERRLSSIYNAVGDVIFHLAVEAEEKYRFLSVNQTFLHVTGLRHDQVVGRTVDEVIPEPSLTMVLGKYKQAIGENRIIRWEEISDYPTGQLIGDVSIVPVINDKGRCTHLIGSVHDITERKRTEEALQESEEKYKALFQNKITAMLVIDPHEDGKIVDANPAAESLYGWTHEELIGMKISEINILTKEQVNDEMKKALSSKKIFFQFKHRTADKTIKDVEVYSSYIQIQGKDLLYSIIIDKTEQRKTEENLKKSEFMLSRAELVSEFGNWEFDFKTGNVIASAGARKIYGVGDKELTIKNIQKISLPEYREKMDKALKELIEENKPYNIEFKIKKYDTGEIVDIHSVAEYDKKNNIVFGVIQDITEHKIAEEALRKNEARLKEAQRMALVSNWEYDIMTGKMWGSEEAFKAYGLKLSSSNEMDINEVEACVEDKEKVNKALLDLIKNNTPYDIEIKVNPVDGSTKKIMHSIAYCIRDEKGNPVKVLGVIQDITERKRAEEELKENERKLREAQEMAHLGYWTWDIKTGDVEWSEEVYKIFRLDPQEFIPQIDSILAFSPWPEDHQRDKELINRAMESHEPGSYIQKFLRPDKSIGYYYSTFHGNYDENGNLITIVGTIIDITERKQAEDALRENELFLRRTQEIGNIGSYILEVSEPLHINKIWRSTKVFEEIFGIDESYPRTGESWLSLIVQRKEVEEYFEQEVLGKGKKFEIEYQILRPKDKEMRWVFCYGELEYDSQGKPLRLIGTAQDITERKKIEEEIKILNTDLEKRVLERTSQLLITNKELESFSYSVSHDLRAPLRAINGFSKVLLDKLSNSMDEVAKRYLKIIITNSNNMGQLIDDLLNFSRVGRKEMLVTEINMDDQVQGIIKDIKLQAGKREIEFIIRTLPSALGDVSMIRIVLNNLFSNAVKFTGKKEKAIIEFEGKIENYENIYCIKDNGVGFNMKYIDKIFGVFQRLHSQDEFEGTGVGLALVHRIINKHGGRVWANGKINEGASFYFTLPIKGGDS